MAQEEAERRKAGKPPKESSSANSPEPDEVVGKEGAEDEEGPEKPGTAEAAPTPGADAGAGVEDTASLEPPGPCKQVHAWVLVMPGKREVSRVLGWGDVS